MKNILLSFVIVSASACIIAPSAFAGGCTEGLHGNIVCYHGRSGLRRAVRMNGIPSTRSRVQGKNVKKTIAKKNSKNKKSKFISRTTSGRWMVVRTRSASGKVLVRRIKLY